MYKLLDLSIKKARILCDGDYSRRSMFAFIYDKSKLISYGENNIGKTDAFVKYIGEKFNIEQFKNFHYPHAEIDAISKMWGSVKILPRHRLVVVRFLKNGDTAYAKPCQYCQKIINIIGIKKICWTNYTNG